jgi:hypothetical protein
MSVTSLVHSPGIYEIAAAINTINETLPWIDMTCDPYPTVDIVVITKKNVYVIVFW